MKSSVRLAQLVVLGFLILGHFANGAKAQALKPADFAYGIEIDTVGQEPVQAFVLPRAVYEHLTQDDLGDLRIFNSAGASIPHALHHAAETPEALEKTFTLPLFPVYGQAQQSLGDLSVQVQRTGGGTLVRVNNQAPRTQSLRAYIVDASQLDASIHRLKLDWKELPENLMVNVSIETSDNLKDWQRWGTGLTLTSMRYNDNVLVRNTIDLPARKAAYYRISWQQSATFPVLDALEATTAPDRPELERHWTDIPMAQEEEGIFVATAPGTLPADRIEIALPEAQTIARVKIESSPTGNDPWMQQYAGLAYNLQAGEGQWQSSPISIYKSTHKYWRMKVDEEASGIVLGTPTLRIGWVPARLLFIPQGPAPYTLAFGNAEATSAGFQSGELFRPVADDYESVFDLPTASTGTISKLGGEARLEAPTDIPWQKIVLWGTMVLGVIVLGSMALKLLREPKEA
ncbi:MAG: DUF3999 domain-containing protein [Rhodothermales bacterium]